VCAILAGSSERSRSPDWNSQQTRARKSGAVQNRRNRTLDGIGVSGGAKRDMRLCMRESQLVGYDGLKICAV
jgi:hypothetical protein